MKIGELAKLANCSVETVRYYEKEGLIPHPTRNENNYRQYEEVHLERLRFIRNCRALDLNHDEIRELLAMTEPETSECNMVNDVLDEHLNHVRTRITELQQLEKSLMKLHTLCELRCNEEQPDCICGILHGLTELDYEAPTNVVLNTHKSHDFSHS